MTAKKIYAFENYKTYLAHMEQNRSQFIRGFRSRVSEAIGCNNAFISQVLNGNAHFSLEQAIKIAAYLNLGEAEERYFLLLIEHARSGTPALRNHFEKLLDELKDKHLNIKNRVKHQTILSIEDQTTYYSQWYYSAVHMMVTVPEFRKVPEIAKALKLNKTLVDKVVLFLLSCGLLTEKNQEFLPGPSYLHLEHNSPNISKHHTNWRMVAINSLQNDDKGDVHYSTVSSLSKKDVERIRQKFVNEIQEYVQGVSQSKEETIYCFNLDFFKLITD
jgi:uncharacterized protein (TIGR02147 family)